MTRASLMMLISFSLLVLILFPSLTLNRHLLVISIHAKGLIIITMLQCHGFSNDSLLFTLYAPQIIAHAMDAQAPHLMSADQLSGDMAYISLRIRKYDILGQRPGHLVLVAGGEAVSSG